MTANRRVVACMEIPIDLKGEHAKKEAHNLVADGPLTPFQAILKLLPLLTDEERDRLAEIIRERAC